MSAKKVNQIWRALNKEGQPQHQLLPFPIATDDASSFQTSDLFNSSHGQAATRKEPHEYSEQHQQYERPCDLFSLQANKYSTGIIFKDMSSCDNVSVTDRISNAPIKWMSSKMRLMRKMMAREQIKIKQPRRRMQPPQGQSLLNPEIYNGNISPSGIVIIRVCSDCNTTKTPLWRSGPKGPKSLCNACGIRQMKARRAMTASASVLNDALIMRKRKTLHVDRTMPYKKRYKFTNLDADHAKLQFNHTAIGLKESTSSFHQTFPQDEKDAAILLMTLSCG